MCAARRAARFLWEKAFPLGGRWRAGAPDEGEMSGRLALPQNSKEGSRPLPTSNRKVSSYRQSIHFRQVCRGRIYASRAVCPIGSITGLAATGGIYAAPTDYP